MTLNNLQRRNWPLLCVILPNSATWGQLRQSGRK